MQDPQTFMSLDVNPALTPVTLERPAVTLG
eukprot:COSAG01_NODE_36347_length_519_cov_0.740476_1_plen_29_part_10